MDVRRARRVKVGLAALAVLGIGAALTSAAWTDVVFFDADVTTGSFNLQGAVPANQDAPAVPTTPWLESADSTAIELHLGSVQLSPTDTVVLTGYVRNDPTSTWTGDLTSISVDQADLPQGITATVVFTTPSATPTGLAPGAVATFEVTVTADTTVVQKSTGSLVVEVNGQSADPIA